MSNIFQILTGVKNILEKCPRVDYFSVGGDDRTIYIWGPLETESYKNKVAQAVKSIHPELKPVFNPDFEVGPPWDPQKPRY